MRTLEVALRLNLPERIADDSETIAVNGRPVKVRCDRLTALIGAFGAGDITITGGDAIDALAMPHEPFTGLSAWETSGRKEGMRKRVRSADDASHSPTHKAKDKTCGTRSRHALTGGQATTVAVSTRKDQVNARQARR